MPVVKRQDSSSGVQAEFWVLADVHGRRDSQGGLFSFSGRYSLYLDEAAYRAGRSSLHDGLYVQLGDTAAAELLAGGADIDALFDAAAVAESTLAVPEGALEAAAEEGTAPPGARRFPGGALEGGTIVPIV